MIAAGDVGGFQDVNSVTLLCLRLLIIDAIVSFFALTLFTEEAQTLIFFCLHCWKLFSEFFSSTLVKFSTPHTPTLLTSSSILTRDAQFHLLVLIFQLIGEGKTSTSGIG